MNVEVISSLARPIENLRGNKERWGTQATPPDRDHYPHTFLWDSAFHTIVYAHFGHPEDAAKELVTVLGGQKENGMVPNMSFGPGRKYDPERRTFRDPDISSDYTQPPLLAHAAMSVVSAYEANDEGQEADEFAHAVYPNLAKYYQYLTRTRTSEGSSLIGIIHPHETGRDSDPTFDFAKKRLPQPRSGFPVLRGVVDKINSASDYISALNINRQHKKNGWQEESARDVFWVEDVMFNAIFAQNLSYLADLAQKTGRGDEAQVFKMRSADVSEDILSNMWDEQDKRFYAKDRSGAPIKVLSVSNLFPIILPQIQEDQVESILDSLESPDEFNSPFPIPSVARGDRTYDPAYSEKRLWRGPVWMNMNWYIVMGLLTQRDRFADTRPDLAQRLNSRALHIAQKSAELVDRQGYREFYNSENGDGKRVHNFGWSTLGDIVKSTIPDMEDFSSSAR